MTDLKTAIQRVLSEKEDGLSDPEKVLKNLLLGAAPTNAEEEKLAAEISQIKAAGGIVDIPEM